MSNPQSQLIPLLERLSVVRRSICTLQANSVGMNGETQYHLRLPSIRPGGAFAIYSHKAPDLADCAFILMAVLEEAHARKLEFYRSPELLVLDPIQSRDEAWYMQPTQADFRVVLPSGATPVELTAVHLELLVLWLEARAAMDKQGGV